MIEVEDGVSVMKSIPFYSQFSLERPLLLPNVNTTLCASVTAVREPIKDSLRSAAIPITCLQGKGVHTECLWFGAAW